MALPSARPHVPCLWPFDDVWKAAGSSSGAPSRPRPDAAATGKAFVQDAIQFLWSMQDGLTLPKAKASALATSVLATLKDHPERSLAVEWLPIIEAQQLALDGDIPAARSLLSSLRDQHAIHGSPLSMACEVFGWYRLALLTAGPLTAESLKPGLRQSSHQAQPLQVAMASALPTLDRLKSQPKQLPRSVQAHLSRIAIVAHPPSSSAFGQSDWLRLLHDSLRTADGIQRAHAILALGLAYRSQGLAERAHECFVQTRATATQLQWQQGAWSSGIELLSLDHSDPELAPSLHEWLVAWQRDTTEASTRPAEQDSQTARSPHARVDRATAIIRQDVGRRYSVEALARDCGVSSRTLSQDFKDVLGVTPLAFITHERMVRARQLLSEGEHALIDVAIKVGYDTALGLSKAYAKTFGELPRSKFAGNKR